MDMTRTLDCAFVEENDFVSRYVAGKLPEEEAEAFEAHYFGCERCFREVRAATEFRAAMEKPAGAPVVPLAERRERRRRQVFSGRALALAASLLIAAVAGVLVWRGAGGGSGMEALARASEGRRNIDARLSGPFAWAPLAPVYRGEEANQVPAKVRAAAAEAEARAEENPAAQNLHASGVGQLLVGAWDAAIETLEQAKSKEPKNASILSDLAAAYHARSIQRDRPADLRPAFEAAKEAIEIDPSLRSARYNLALVLEAIHLRDDARAAWQEYLKLDGSSEWADEARRRLAELNKPTDSELWLRERDRLRQAAASGRQDEVTAIVRRFPQQSRQWGEDELLAEWAGERAADTVRPESLRAARSLAMALREALGESLLFDDLAAIDAADGPRMANAREELRMGFRSFGRARALYRAADISTASSEFEHALAAFSKSRSPHALLAELGLASCAAYRLDTDAIQYRLDAMEGRFDPASYPSLQARVSWMRGLISTSRGYLDDALGHFGVALEVSERLGDRENVSGLRTLLGSTLETLGDRDGAWRHHVQALAALPAAPAPSRAQVALSELGRNARGAGAHRLAETIHDRQVINADRARIPVFQAEARSWRALSRPPQNSALVLADLEDARKYGEQITDDGVRGRMRGELALASAEALRRSDPAGAERALDDADRFFRDAADQHRLPEVEIARARLEHAGGNAKASLATLLEALEGMQAIVKTLPTRAARVAYLSTATEAIETSVDLADRLGEPVLALQLTQRARTASPQHGLADARREIDKIRGSIPERSAILVYWVLRDRTLGWLLTRGDFEPRTLPVSGAQLAALVARLRERAQGSPAGAGPFPEAEQLHGALIAPFEGALAGVSAIAIVPHGELWDLPFGLLTDAQSGKPLVERYTLSILPFAARFPEIHQRTPRGSGSHPDALLVLGDTPERDADRPALPEARREIEAVASLFPRAVVIRGSEFTPSSVRGVPIVHFALHAEGHREAPYLALAPKRALGAAAVEELPLSESAVVVLAACETGRGSRSPVGRVATLPQAAFLTGAGAVVATLWPIRDADAARFSEAYYASLLATGKPVLALQKAQRSLIASGQPPSTWAAFVVFGFSPEVGLEVPSLNATPHRRKENV